MSADGSLEIERKFLLRSMPDLPAGAEVWHIEQGYLSADSIDSNALHGRLRRATNPQGLVICTHTLKSGAGLVKTELERRISEEEFQLHWPRTQGARLRKTRSCIRDQDLIWEIDQFHDISLLLAEVELPSADLQPHVPEWLRPHILREVTDDPSYTNSSIARRIG